MQMLRGSIPKTGPLLSELESPEVLECALAGFVAALGLQHSRTAQPTTRMSTWDLPRRQDSRAHITSVAITLRLPAPSEYQLSGSCMQKFRLLAERGNALGKTRLPREAALSIF